MHKSNSPFIGIASHTLRKVKELGELDIGDLTCNKDNPKRFGKIKDLKKTDHIIIYPSSRIWISNYSSIKCQISLIIDEPKVVHYHYYAMLWLLRLKFYRVFTHFSNLDKRFNNVISMPVANSWITANTKYCLQNKEKLVSLIASKKIKYKGHELRHEIANAVNTDSEINIDLLGRAYKPLKNKKDGLLPYKFSIIIENSQEKDYFTEKLLDCFICGTIPIYWGAPNIGHYFNIEGMLVFNNLEDLLKILSEIETYDINSIEPVIQLNYKIACSFAKANERIINKLRETLGK